MTEREALKLAQKALSNRNAPAKTIYEALAAIQKALAQPEEKYRYGTPLLDAFTKEKNDNAL
jgi:methanogenic corrinoid protein MtbC1